MEGGQVDPLPFRVAFPDMVLEPAVDKYELARRAPIVDGPHVLGLHVPLHLALFLAGLAADQADKAHVPRSHLELHQRLHVVVHIGNI